MERRNPHYESDRNGSFTDENHFGASDDPCNGTQQKAFLRTYFRRSEMHLFPKVLFH